VSLYQNKSANNRQPHDFAISHDESEVLRRCKQIFRTNERDGEGGETEKSRQGRRKDGKWRRPPRAIFHKTHLDPPIVSILTRVLIRRVEDVRRTERPSLDRKLSEQSAVKHATKHAAPREEGRAFLSFFFYFLFSLLHTGDAKNAANSRDTWKRDLLQGPPDSWRS